MDESLIGLFQESFGLTISHYFTLVGKLVLIVLFVALVLFLSKKFIKRFQVHVQEQNLYEENTESFVTIAGEMFFYLVLVVSASIALYLAGFQTIYIIMGATFATGYACKELFQNLVAGLLIMTTKELAIGDLVEIYIDDKVHFGRIDKITIRYTIMRKLNMTRVIIPNRLLTRVPIITLGAEENVRLQTSFLLLLPVDLHWLLGEMKKVVMQLESVTEKEFTCITVDGFPDGNVLLTVYFYFDPKSGKLRFRVISEVNIALADFFTQHGITFAYHHETITTDAVD